MEPEKKSNGALVGSIIVIIILVLGGIYLWTTKVQNIQKEREQAKEAVLKTYDELDNFDKELDPTNLDINIDVGDVN